MILGTLGHIADGTKENATPKTSMITTANQPLGGCES